jgi:hypothetical protein
VIVLLFAEAHIGQVRWQQWGARNLMSELILFYALLSIPVLMGLAYGFYSYRSYIKKKRRA